MNPVRVLFLLSADFGEYVTASLFARGQPFASQFAMPPGLARYVTPADVTAHVYVDLESIKALVTSQSPKVVILCSAHLFAINRLLSVEQLGMLLEFLARQGIVVATTDPWLRIWSFRPDSRLRIYSVRQGREDLDQSARMAGLQKQMEKLLGGLPHVFAVPLRTTDPRSLPFHNPLFTSALRVATAGGAGASDEWLFVLSSEDFVYLAGFERQSFFLALDRRIEALLSEPRNRLTFVGPEPLWQAIRHKWGAHPRLEFLVFCDVVRFESLVARARVVAYWNVLSSSLLYCLYYRVPPIFFGAGHQAKLCEGLLEHVAEHVYRGRPPPLLELGAPLTSNADELIRQLDLERWLDLIGDDYARSPGPDQVIESLLNDHG